MDEKESAPASILLIFNYVFMFVIFVSSLRVGYLAYGPLGGFVTFVTPPLSQLFWFFYTGNRLGYFGHWYNILCWVWFALVALQIIVTLCKTK